MSSQATPAATHTVNGATKTLTKNTSNGSKQGQQQEQLFPETGNHIPEAKHQWLVQTPYGVGCVIRTTTRYYPHTTASTKTNHHGDNETSQQQQEQEQQGIVMEPTVVHEIELIDWKSSSTAMTKTRSGPIRPAMLYAPMSRAYPSVEPQIGSEVLVLLSSSSPSRGSVLRGQIVAITEQSGTTTTTTSSSSSPSTAKTTDPAYFKVRLSSWRLAARNTVTCYCQRSQLQVVRNKRLYEMSVHEKLDHAQDQKLQAATAFAQQDYVMALHHYQLALDSVRYIQHRPDLDNYARADLLSMMITCSNNAATCAAHLVTAAAAAASAATTKQGNRGNSNISFSADKMEGNNGKTNAITMATWDHVANWASAALALLDALEAKRGMRIHSILISDGSVTDLKLFGEWRVKSLLLLAKACLYGKDDADEALVHCKRAYSLITQYTVKTVSQTNGANGSSTLSVSNASRAASIRVLLQQGKQVKKLHESSKERRRVLLKKEKQRAMAMFASNNASNSNNDDDEDVNSSSSTGGCADPKPEHATQNGVASNNKTTTATIITIPPTLSQSSSLAKEKEQSPSFVLDSATTNTEAQPVTSSPSMPSAPATATKSTTSLPTTSTIKSPSIKDDDSYETLEWYHDSEVLSGLAIFVSAVGIAMLGWHFLLHGRK